MRQSRSQHRAAPRRPRPGALAAALGLAVLAVPAAAGGAAQVSINGGTLTITATGGDDRISIGSAGSNALGPTTSVNGNDMVAGGGCQGVGDLNGPANDSSVFCPTNDIQRISATLLAGDDELTFSGDLDVTVDAGTGDDDIDLGTGANTVDGGIGNDTIRVGGLGADRQNVLDGGPDADTMRVGRATEADDVSGGDGVDTVDYSFHQPVTVTLDDVADDGSAGEGDNVRVDVENVTGTQGGDTLIGSEADNTLDGAGGADRLEGRGGNDTLIGGTGVDTLLGGAGDDTLLLRDGTTDACPDGGTGTNTIDLDLADQFVPSIIPGVTVRRICLSPAQQALLASRPRVQIVFRAVDEGPVSRLSLGRPAVLGGRVRVQVQCPAVLRAACVGRLRVATRFAGGSLGETGYSVAAGRTQVVPVPLTAAGRATIRLRRTVVLISSERGRSPLGPKTSFLVVALPR